MSKSFDVAIIGGGMIVHDQILPALWQMQRKGGIGSIRICARRESTLRALEEAPLLREAFPAAAFTPDLDPFTAVVRKLKPRQLVIIALPDPLHYEAVMAALAADQHVLCVKPLVLTARESEAIAKEAARRNLLVTVEYHKRLDDRALLARRRYREGRFGEFRLGTAILFEKWNYRDSNFQEWFTKDATDAFTYIGCHYVDLVHFITGLRPAAVSVYAQSDRFPNGKEGWLWTDARVLWENGACLNLQNALGYPNAGPGSNIQGMQLWCSDGERGAFLRHSDQYRGIEYCFAQGDAPLYSEPSTEYMQYVPLEREGLRPVGYGIRSIEFLVAQTARVEAGESIAAIDAEGLAATPANSLYNELVVEAGRMSIEHDSRLVRIHYAPTPHVTLA
jgi:D-galacturonate reductase